MVRIIAGALSIVVLALAPAAGAGRAGLTPEKAMRGWPEGAKVAARITMAKYGRPQEAGPDALVWRSNGPWKKTVVHRRAWPRDPAGEDRGYLENTIVYRVPGDSLENLARFDSKLDVDPRFSEMSSRSESESVNFLVLNLAHEIIGGKRSSKDARLFAERATRLSAAGKSSPYLERLLFEPRL